LLFNPVLNYDFGMTKKLLELLKKDLKKKSINSFAKEIQIPYATLYRITHKQSTGSIRIWERIEKYYKGRE